LGYKILLTTVIEILKQTPEVGKVKIFIKLPALINHVKGGKQWLYNIKAALKWYITKNMHNFKQ